MHLLTFPESYPGLEKSFGMFWRFAPMADPYIEEWHSRDLDATIIQREVDAVNDWKKSGKGFHIMRDHPGHGAQILGGMFGARQNTLIRKRSRQQEFSKMISLYGSEKIRGVDQDALAAVVAPNVAADSLAHDSFHCRNLILLGSDPVAFPSKRADPVIGNEKSLPNFVGNTGNDQLYEECSVWCRPSNHKDWKFC